MCAFWQRKWLYSLYLLTNRQEKMETQTFPPTKYLVVVCTVVRTVNNWQTELQEEHGHFRATGGVAAGACLCVRYYSLSLFLPLCLSAFPESPPLFSTIFFPTSVSFPPFFLFLSPHSLTHIYTHTKKNFNLIIIHQVTSSYKTDGGFCPETFHQNVCCL